MTFDALSPLQQLAVINRQFRELEDARRRALFEARLQGSLDRAIQISGLSRKRALAETRKENEARGRIVRWNSV